MNKPRPLKHWSNYWQGGHLTSLPGDFRLIYDGEIEAFWAEIAQGMKDGAKVLDVCTGNGPVALLIARHARQAQMWAADAASIDPARTLEQHPALAELAAQIQFLPETPTESVAALDEQFDLVTSQYGVEYTDWDASAQAIASVIKPGGRLALITHVPTSSMVAVMQAEQQEYVRLEETNALQSLQEFGKKGNNTARKALKRCVIRLRQDASTSQLLGNFVHSSNALIAMDTDTLMSQQKAIRQYCKDLLAGRDRAQDLLTTNQRILEEPRWFEIFEEYGLKLSSEREIIYQNNHHCGLALVFNKPQA